MTTIEVIGVVIELEIEMNSLLKTKLAAVVSVLLLALMLCAAWFVQVGVAADGVDSAETPQSSYLFLPMLSAINCPIEVTASSEAELNAAIKCFNLAPKDTSRTINIGDNITRTVAGSVIDNSGAATLFINGAKFIIDGNSQWIAFEVSHGNVQIEQLTVRNSSKGIDMSNGDLTCNECIFVNNRTGGAISYFGDGDLTIESSLFHHNFAAGDGGGAIDVFDFGGKVNVNIKESMFVGNSAEWGGGAISFRGRTLVVQDSHFSHNAADWNGGAINFSGRQLALYSNSFSNNAAKWGGGAISHHTGGEAQIDNSNFSENSAGWSGGAIEFQGGNHRVQNSTFSLNVATSSGGAIDNGVELVIENSQFLHNSTYGSGGAIVNSGLMHVYGSDFSSNTAQIEGNNIYNDGGTVTVE